jgi:predicted PurR-regulated permease PerM
MTRTDPHLRAVALAVLLGLFAWWASWGKWGRAAIDGVLIVVLLMQWWNERSKRR